MRCGVIFLTKRHNVRVSVPILTVISLYPFSPGFCCVTILISLSLAMLSALALLMYCNTLCTFTAPLRHVLHTHHRCIP
ncbi:hypothetical protein BDV98DRAFT_577048 [Pterulicium gracile]|uniref:Uncharacterized protein n=1 Tax=Pterulicium gracile TaxID=1884261 RepID=A0A5C3QBN7_9AGAR|nr:hypothetical protein BDV98DRAFT_577048 [Pterula gracilis]